MYAITTIIHGKVSARYIPPQSSWNSENSGKFLLLFNGQDNDKSLYRYSNLFRGDVFVNVPQ